jgi:hypothetical protein
VGGFLPLSFMETLEKKIKLNYADTIRLQILIYCFINKISLSDNEISCLVLLSSYSNYNLSKFCVKAVEYGIFKSPQTVRNFLVKAVNMGLVKKEDMMIQISDKLELKRIGDILLKYNFLYVSKKQS